MSAIFPVFPTAVNAVKFILKQFPHLLVLYLSICYFFSIDFEDLFDDDDVQ